ncbi:MAG: DUF4270 family protein [Bacteroidota bacterium]
MKRSYLFFSLIAIVATVAVLFSACRKINDFTELGGGLIPPVDNINTFDTSISVFAFNDTFSLASDSLRITSDEEHFLGLINTDPIFGRTDAEVYMELKPEFYGFYPFARKDSLKLDSVVLVLGYVERYGDSLATQTINVHELTQAFKRDSSYLVRKQPLTYSAALLNAGGFGQTIFPSALDDSVKAFRDTTAGQVRLKLDTSFARRLMNYDTSNAYRSDSAFKSLFKGFAIRSVSTGGAIIGLNMNSANTKLAFYYKLPKKSGTFDSVAVSYFNFHVDCRSANYVRRDYAGTPVAMAAGQTLQAPVVYIQKTPGSFANIKIPDLPAISNRVIHRAELIVEQLYHPSDDIFSAPSSMYVDAYDSTITDSYKYRTIPASLDFSPNSGFDFVTFGTTPVNAKDPAGNNIRVWKFNLSRYVQHIVRGTQTSYDLRLYAPLTIRGQTKLVGGGSTDYPVFSGSYVNTSIANGRIRVGGGNHPTQRMRLRLIYSKL